MDTMLVISGPWGTFASLFFFLAALLGGDLLALRGCLFLAYVFLLINGATGLPQWAAAAVQGKVGVDMIVWAVAAGLLHGCAVVRMLMDELPVRWSCKDDEQLTRFLNRRSGMEPLEAKEVLKRGRWLRVRAGQRVVSSVELYQDVYLLVEGCCSFLNPCCPSSPATPVTLSPAHSAALQGPLQRLNSATLAGLQEQTQQQNGFGHFTLTRSRNLSDDMLTSKAIDVEMSFSSAFLDTQPVKVQRPVPAAMAMDSHSVSTGAISLTPADDPAVAGSITFAVMGEQLKAAEQIRSGTAVQTMPAAADLALEHRLSAAEAAAAASPHATPRKAAQAATISRLHRSQRLLRSGHIFSLSALNVFGVYIGFDQYHGSQLEVWAETDCLLYSWRMSALEEMAMGCSPSLAAYWRNFITYSVASEFEMTAHKRMMLCRCSTGEYEAEDWAVGGRSRDFTDPPRQYERPAGWTWQRCRRWLLRAVSPFPPPGIRHTALPSTGVMARTRAMAVAEARAQAAHSRDVSVRLGIPGSDEAHCHSGGLNIGPGI